jgi:hypothetical protein
VCKVPFDLLGRVIRPASVPSLDLCHRLLGSGWHIRLFALLGRRRSLCSTIIRWRECFDLESDLTSLNMASMSCGGTVTPSFLM